jgi:hypothetical protein
MTRNKRTLVYVAFALILGAALATAVVLARTPAPAGGTAARAAVVSQSSGSVLGDTLGSASVAAADPAKQQPLLDKFTSKDPFIPLTTTSSGGGGSSSGGGGSSTTTAYAAKIKVDGSSYTVVNGDKVPSGTAAFSVSSVTSGDVTFAVIEGTLENGDSAITVNLGESVKVTIKGGKNDGKSYTLAVDSIGSKSSGGGSNGSGSGGTISTSGHTISVLSVTSSSGVALATIEVDGKTYPDKKVGMVITTSWGQVKILAIDVNGQTVTVMHGDQTVVLRAGQVVV